jgi:7,8-dihydropterin-6-yl-methyl-4-(beta-D-ribofuranosyl)aminobenzene 5'-phosphate synthase
MEIRITTLSENTANYGYLAEWGLSILVEVDGLKVLMDTGQSFSAIHNAQLMGIDLTTINRIVLSHGHADHTGGLRELLRVRGEVEIVAHPDIWASKYTRRDGQAQEQFIGIPFTREELENLGAQFKLTKEPVYISSNVITTGEIPMVTSYEKIENNLFIKESGVLRQDPMADDQALIIKADFGLVIISGCAHHGIINTIRHAQKLTGNNCVYAVIGGTHLFRASEERIENTISELRQIGVKKLGVSHCTGFHASVRLAQKFGDIFFLNNAGKSIILP